MKKLTFLSIVAICLATSSVQARITGGGTLYVSVLNANILCNDSSKLRYKYTMEEGWNPWLEVTEQAGLDDVWQTFNAGTYNWLDLNAVAAVFPDKTFAPLDSVNDWTTTTYQEVHNAVTYTYIDGVLTPITVEQIFEFTVYDATVRETVPQTFIAVTDISGDVPTEMTAGEQLTLQIYAVSGGKIYEYDNDDIAYASPSNATNRHIEWSVADAGTTGAEVKVIYETEVVYAYIDGILTAKTWLKVVPYLTTLNAGTLVLRATITDGAAVGADFIKDFTITVTDPTGISELKNEKLKISVNGNLLGFQNLTGLEREVVIFDVAGRAVEALRATPLQSSTINISHLPAGIYIVKAGDKSAKFIKK